MKKFWKLLASGLLVLGLASCGEQEQPDVQGDTSVAVQSVTLSQSSLSMILGQEDVTLTATVAPSNATDKSVTWESSNPSVVTVANGVVHAVADGIANITCSTKNGWLASACAVTVDLPAEVLSLQVYGFDADPVTHEVEMVIEDTDELEAMVIAKGDGLEETVTWSVEDESVVSIEVDDDGKCTVTAVGVGQTTVTCTSDDNDEICKELTYTVLDQWSRSEALVFDTYLGMEVPYIPHSWMQFSNTYWSSNNELDMYISVTEGLVDDPTKQYTAIEEALVEGGWAFLQRKSGQAQYLMYDETCINYCVAIVLESANKFTDADMYYSMVAFIYVGGATEDYEKDTLDAILGYEFVDLSANEGAGYFHNTTDYTLYNFSGLGWDYYTVQADCLGYTWDIQSDKSDSDFYSSELGYYDNYILGKKYTTNYDKQLNGYTNSFFVKNTIAFQDALSLNVILQRIQEAGYAKFYATNGFYIFYTKLQSGFYSWVEVIVLGDAYFDDIQTIAVFVNIDQTNSAVAQYLE